MIPTEANPNVMSIRVRIIIAHLRDVHPHKHPLARGKIRQNFGSSTTSATAFLLTRADLSSLKFLTFYLFENALGIPSLATSSLFSSLAFGEGSPLIGLNL